jgi:ketosteroid isomerase-like protein
MKTSSLLLTGITLGIVFQFGCAPAQPPMALDHRAAVEQTIRDGEAQWVKDFAAKNVEKVASHYADNASSMIPDMALMTGQQEIRAGLKEEFSDLNSSLDFHPTKVEVSKSEDVAYSQGKYTYTSTDPKTKKALIEHGNYVEVYKIQADGSWKVVADIATQEAPPAPMKVAK